MGLPVHLGHLLHFQSRDYYTSHGIAFLLSDLAGVIPFSFFIMEIVEKKAQVLDFVLTSYLVYFVLGLVYSLQLPSLAWLFGTLVSLATSVMVGEICCAWKMGREILLSEEVSKAIELERKDGSTLISEEKQPINRNSTSEAI